MCINGLAAAPGDFSVSVVEVAEHLFVSLPGKQTFDKHLEYAGKIMDCLITKGLVELDENGFYRASLINTRRTLPELIRSAARELNLKI
jgi:hypothetical protein